MYIEVVSLILVIIIAVLYSRSNRRIHLPPGPPGWPVIGNALQILKDPHIKLSNLVEKYGKLFTIRLGLQEALVVSDEKIMKEIFSHPASTGKFKTDTFLLLSRGPYGTVNTEGETWAEQRKFALNCLVDHGFGSRTTVEPIIIAEVQDYIESMKVEMKEKGCIVPITKLFNVASNTLWTIMSGERLTSNSSIICELLLELTEAMQVSVRTGLGFLPWLKYIIPTMSGYTRLDIATKRIHEFIEQIIKEHMQEFKPGAPRDVIDSIIDHQMNVKDRTSSFFGTYGEKNSVATIVDLFEAGGSAVAYALDWIILYLCQHPNVQRKLQIEIDSVVGPNRDPSLQDKAKMPYTEAVILEAFRKSSLVPMGLIHQLTDDLEYKGYRLPKGMLLIPNMYHIHHDPEVWNDPDVFQPERFLDATETVIIKKEKIVPFQAGKRVCLGEPLARDIIFLVTAKLFQAFDITPDPKNPKTDLEPSVGVGLIAKPYKCVMSPRFLK